MISLWWRLHAAADLSISSLVSIKLHKHLRQETMFLFICISQCLFCPKCVFGTHPLCSTTIPSFHEDMMSVLRVTATCSVSLQLVFTIWLEIQLPKGEICLVLSRFRYFIHSWKRPETKKAVGVSTARYETKWLVVCLLCEHPPVRITEGTLKRRLRSLNRRQNEAVCRVAEGSRFIRQTIVFADRIRADRIRADQIGSDQSGSERIRSDCFGARRIVFYCTYICFWCLTACSENTHKYSPADKSTIIHLTFNPPGDGDVEFTERRCPSRSPSSSGDLTPLRPLIDYLQAQHGGPHRLSSFLFPSSPRFTVSS